MLRVGLHENFSILFLLAIKTAGSAQKLRVGRVSGNIAIFLFYLRLTWPTVRTREKCPLFLRSHELTRKVMDT